MKEIKIFENPTFGNIRTAGTSDEPLFCLADVCRVLELQVTPTKNRLKQDGVSLIKGVSKTTNQYGITTEQEVMLVFVNEQNLYRVIMRSDKPMAEPFQDWVCGEVLPSIRKTGSYGLPQTFAEALRLAADQQEQIEEQAKQIGEQQKAIQQSAQEIVALSDTITQMQPKVSYYDKILASKETLTVTQVAQDYGMSAKAFNILLRNFGIQHKVNGQWILYAKYLQQGYVHSKSVEIVRHNGQRETKNNTEWLQKGRLFLYEELRKHDVLPLIERG